MTPLTFGAAKTRLARAFGGANGVTDARVAEYANYAMATCIRELAGMSADGKPWTPRGVWVGGVDQLTFTAGTGGAFTLPATHEVALEVEMATDADIKNGWFSTDLAMAGLVDPDASQDTLLIDGGLDGSGNRQYTVPDAPAGTVLKVMAKKRFAPVSVDVDLLCVPNLDAVTAMMVAVWKRDNTDNPDESEKYRAIALRSLATELNGYLLDPTRANYRRQAYIADERTYTENTLGYIRAVLAQQLPNGLKIGKSAITRGINEAVREALQHRNSLAATETYSNNPAGPDIEPFTRSLAATDVLPYPNIEVLKLLCLAQASDDGSGLREQAFALIERNLAKAVMATRNAQWQCLLSLPRFTFGWMRAKIGLGLAERGFTYSDAKVGRMVNDAEDALSHTPNFKNGEGAYSVVADANGIVTLPADSERIIYADVCGIPLEIKHRSHEYIPIPAGYGVQPNFFSTFANWNVTGPFGYRGTAALQDRGYDTNGNRTYFMQGCWVTDTGTLTPTSAGASINVVVKRKYLPKVADSDVMLVQKEDAIRKQVESEIARLDGRLADAGALEAAAAAALDQQLQNEKAGETIVPKFTVPGRMRRGGVPTLYRRRF